MTTKHATCDHESTPAARAICRKAATEAATLRLVEATRDYLESRGVDQTTMARHKAARAVLDYVAHTGHLP